MFTGIIEGVGTVAALETRGDGGARLVLTPESIPVAELALGESVAVNGCCLTVAELDTASGRIAFDLLAETLRVTNLGDLETGGGVNLERSLRAGDRMSGHWVQGHVDCVSEVLAFEQDGEDYRFEIALPAEFAQYVVSKGSIAVDGISLTVAIVTFDPEALRAEASGGQERLTIWIIPHTREVTNLRDGAAGKRVNLEFDILAKYVERQRAVKG